MPQLHRVSVAAAAMVGLCLPGAVRGQVVFGQASGRNGPLTGVPEQNIATTSEQVHAVVLDSVTGKPVPRVLVTSPDRRMAALTDSEGKFSFELKRAVPIPGDPRSAPAASPLMARFNPAMMPLQLLVRKPGYVTNSVTLRVPPAQPDAPETTLELKIVPGATLTGHVYPETGEPGAHAFVQLRRRQVLDGTATWVQAGGAQVNSRGEFRLANLRPGDYQLITTSQTPGMFGPKPDEATTHGLLAAWYPEGAGTGSDASIHLAPGETASADLAPRAATFYQVTIPVAGVPPGSGMSAALVPDVPGLAISLGGRERTIEGHLPDGSYNIRISSYPPNAASALVHVEVAGAPVKLPPVALTPAFTLEVDVQRDFTDDTKPQPQLQQGPPVFVTLQPIDGSTAFAGTGPARPGLNQDTAEVPNVSPGVYRATAVGRMGYVAAMRSGTTDLLRDPLTVTASGAQPIQVTLRNDFGSLSGRVQTSADDDQMIFVLGIPLDRPQATPINSATMGGWQFNDSMVPPGRYLVLASHQQLYQGLEYRNPDVLAKLTAKGVVVTVSPDQKAEVEVPLLPDDPAAGEF